MSAVQDPAGNAMAAPVSWSFTTSPSCSIWNDSATPAVTSFNDTSPIEVGVKFSTSVTGMITGIRFYKGSLETGTHIGHLWTSTGTLLATATFTGESASGWQEVDFASPVVIAANTVYVASYYAPVGGYAVSGAYFAGSGIDSGPLHALSNTEGNGNGVYIYATGGGFPTGSFNATNYWVDVVYTSGVNNPPPTVTAQSPAPGAAGVSTTATISATFSVPVQAGTISFTLTDPSGNSVPGSVSYDATTNTAVFSPTVPLATSIQYAATVSGATDQFGHAMIAPVSWSFTTTATSTIWSNTATPANPSVNDPAAVNLGVKFESNTPGYVTGIRFYKGTGNTGTHVGYLWTGTGALLASATFTSESTSGWQQVNFATPVAITAGTTYVASYLAPQGHYAADGGYFASSGVDNGVLHAPV